MARGRVRVILRPLLLTLAAIALLAGCAGKGAVRRPYGPELARWTTSVKVFDGLEARIYLSATYKTPEFREAYIEKYVANYELGPAMKADLLERESQSAAEYNEFFLAVYTPKNKWDDLDKKDSVWKLYLVTDTGERLEAVSVTRMDEKDPIVRDFFPYLDLWSTAYNVKFPRYSPSGAEPVPNEKTESIKLIITGVLGKGELEWRMKD